MKGKYVLGLCMLGMVVILAMTTTANAATSTIYVSQPTQVTNSEYYERGESIAYDGTYYWLFYGRSDSVTGNYDNDNPDTHDYKVYYKKATTIEGLAGATANLVTGENNTNIYLGETDAVYFDGKVWVFASSDVGDGCALYTWNTTDGSSWDEWNLSSAMGIGLLPDGAAHFAAAVCNGKLWVAYQLGNDWNAKYWDGTSWSSEYDICTAYGTAKFYVEGTHIYFVRADGDLHLYHYDNIANCWDYIDYVDENGAYDPTIFKVGSNYVCAYAPYDGAKQYIKAKVSNYLPDLLLVSTGVDVNITAGMHGSNDWVDMWPYAFTDANGDTYLFFTSERNPNDPSSEITGNIWYLKVDWDVTQDHFDYIQPAIDAADDGATINVADGTYVEQLDIGKALTIEGAGIGTTIIQSPDTLATKFVTSADNKPIVYIHNTDDVVIKDLTIDGAGKGNANYRFEGVAFLDAGGTLQNLEIKSIRETPLSGAQHGIAIYAWDNAGTDRTIKIENCIVYDYQKNGMALNGANLYAEVRNCTVTGSGPLGSGLPAQNGIQLGYGSTGIVDNNTISDNWYTPESWAACAGLVYDSDDVIITNNTLDNNLIGVYYYGSNGTIAYNTFTNNKWAINLYGDAYIYDNTFSGNTYNLTYMAEIVGTDHFWSSIQDAIDNASDGDTIIVMPGTYSEHIYMEGRNGLTIQSMEGAVNTIIDAKQTGECPPCSPSTPTHPAFYIRDCENITIEGFTIQDVILDASTGDIYPSTDPYLLAGVLLYSSSNCTIRNNILYNFYYGIFLCGEAGLGPCNNNLIADNQLDGNNVAWFGINMYDDGTVDGMENNVISGNIVQNCYYNIYAGWDAVNTTIIGNIVTGSPDLVDYFPNYQFTDPPQELDNGYGIRITGDGVASDGTIGGHLVQGNTVSGCKVGILLNTFNVTVEENTIYNNTIGIGIDDYLHPVTGTEIHHNNIYNNTDNGILNIATTVVDATYNWWGDATGPYYEPGNPDGQGDNVSDNVHFSPWLDAPYPSGNPYTDIFIDTNGNGVYDDGEPAFSSIQDAIDGASDGDTIVIHDGIYREQLTINKPLTLMAGSNPVLDFSGYSGYGIHITADGVTIDGFEIIGIPITGPDDWQSDVNPTILVEANYTTVQNCIFNNASGAPAKEAMLTVNGTHNNSFLNNVVNNYIYGITARCPSEAYGGGAGPGYGATNLTVSGNTFNVAYIDDGSNRITGEAVQIWYGDNIVVTDNVINGPGKFVDKADTYTYLNSIGIADFMSGFGAAGTITYSNNQITNCYVGIATFAGNGIISNNLIDDNYIGIQVGQVDEVLISTPAQGVQILNNDITNNIRGIWVQNFVNCSLYIPS